MKQGPPWHRRGSRGSVRWQTLLQAGCGGSPSFTPAGYLWLVACSESRETPAKGIPRLGLWAQQDSEATKSRGSRGLHTAFSSLAPPNLGKPVACPAQQWALSSKEEKQQKS